MTYGNVMAAHISGISVNCCIRPITSRHNQVAILSQLQFPIKKLVSTIHNNTNSTDFRHFLSNLN